MVVPAQLSRLLDVAGGRAAQSVKVVDTQVTLTTRRRGVRQVQEQLARIAPARRALVSEE